MDENTPFVFLTVTWAADRTHFSLLHQSLQLSPLHAVPHHVVVQHEDLGLFSEFGSETMRILSSAEVLPGDVELRRNQARAWRARVGRDITRTAGSLTRRLGWPEWPRYTGWHTQQITKLAFVAASPVDTVVVLDSDVIVTPSAAIEDFVCPGKIVCYQDLRSADGLRGKVFHWQESAHQLFGERFSASEYDGYYDTPFVMHAPSVRAMLASLENRYQKPWWQVLLQQPPRRWSEFGTYKYFLRHCQNQSVDWRNADIMGYLFDASDIAQLTDKFTRMLRDRQQHYITIHSQSSGRQLWTAEAYVDAVREILRNNV